MAKLTHTTCSPVRTTLRGYAHFAKWSFWLINILLGVPAHLIKVLYQSASLRRHFECIDGPKIPVYANAPLLDPEQDNDGQAWPLVLFSHGLGGNRNNYRYCLPRFLLFYQSNQMIKAISALG